MSDNHIRRPFCLLLVLLVMVVEHAQCMSHPASPGSVLPGLGATAVRRVAVLPPSNAPLAAAYAQPFLGNNGLTPDGLAACYTFESAEGMGPHYRIRVVATDTGKVLRDSLVPQFRNPGGGWFRPDGKKVLFIAGDPQDTEGTGGLGLWKTDWHGATPKRLTMRGYNAVAPAWSPDGTRIAFNKLTPQTMPQDGEQPEFTYALVIIAAAHPDSVLLELPSKGILGLLEYSPDGKWLGCTMGDGRIYLLDTATKRFYPVFDAATVTLHFGMNNTNATIGHYLWLPDSRHLLVQVNSTDSRGYYQRLFLVEITGELRALADGVLLGSTWDARTIILNTHGQNWRFDFGKPTAPHGRIERRAAVMAGGAGEEGQQLTEDTVEIGGSA